MPNKITYTIKTSDGKEYQVSKENIDKHGIQAYADAYKGATIRMRDSKKGDYDIPLANYNDAKAQGLHAFSWEHKPVVAQNNPQATQKQPAPKVNTTPGTPMTAEQKAQVLNNVSGIVAQSQSDLSRTMRKFDYAKQNTGLDVKPVKLGENRKIVKQSSFNPQTGKKEESYLTESGNIHNSYVNAFTEQNAIDDFKEQEKQSKLENQLNAAYKERDSITKALQRRMAELDKQGGHGLLRQFADAMSPDLAMHSSPRDYEMDEEYGALMSAARKNNSTIQILEDKKKGRMNNFWSTLGATFSNGYTFTDGLSGVRDNIAILNANKRADKINRKRQRGEMLTNEEDAFDKALLANLVNEEIEGTYGQEYGALARAAKITASTADVVKDFLLSGGTGVTLTKGVAKGVMNAGAKYLTKKAGESLLKASAKAFGRGLLKATGIGVGSLAGGALITNTTGIGKTAEEMSKQVTGRVGVDQHGNYIFTDSKDLMHAFIEAERSMIGENASEMLGEFIPGSKVLKKGLEKIGLSKISSYLTSIGNKSWAKNYGKLLEAAGWNGLPGEGLEEYAGIAYNSLTGDSEGGIATLGDVRTHIDIWLGCAAAGALLGAPNVVALGANTAQYYRYKHATNKAAQQAKSQLPADRWNALQERIDNTENQDLTNLMFEVYTSKELNPKQKEAVFSYTDNLVKMRGYNIGSINNADATRDEKDEKELHKEENIGNAYAIGYHATEEELSNIKTELELRHRQLAETFKDDPSALQQIEDDPKAFLQGLKESEVGGEKAKVINAYEETRAAYDGMIQRVKDNIDDAITENNTVIEQRTHQDGNIYPATMKLDDRKVYVVGGNVQMNEDGKGIDHEKSSSSVMIRDAETGKIEMVDPSAILSVDTPVNAEEEKATSSEQIRQTYAQEQANKIDGVLEFKAGDTYSILGEDQKQHTIQIIGEAIDEKTKQPNPDMVMASIDGLDPTMLPKEQIQAMNDEENLWRLEQSLKQGEEVENETPHPTQSYSLNDEITLINENGKPVRGSITTDQNEDGKFEVYTEEPINGKRVNLLSAEELDAMTGKQQEQTNQAPEQEEQMESPSLVAENTTTHKEDIAGLNDGTIAENATVQKEEEAPQSQQTALERIPTNEQGEPIYEQADPGTAWDAILEQTEGDESIAQSVADGMVADMEAEVRRAEKAKVKGGTTIAEKIAAEKERVANIEQAKATLEHWKKIASTNSRRQEAIQAEESRKAEEAALLRKEQEEEERAMREEEERVKREALNGVPDIVEDKAINARARGYRRISGDKVDRQEPLNAIKGKEVQVKFDDKNIPTGHVSLIDVDELQPSHKNGQRNPLHFIDEAQPKERKDDASIDAARKIAANIRPEEITSSVTAYTGAPTVNSRGEVIQGNNRSAALKEMWAMHKEQGEKYKQYIIDHAEELGLNPADVRSMKHPVLVNMLDVNDNDAISLGQFVASDTESGGTERIKPKNVVKKLGNRMKTFANILLRTTDEDMSFAELIDRNGVEALKWMSANGSITSTQYKSAFDSKGNLTAEAKNDLKGVMYQSIFEGGSTQLEEMFNALPIKAQKAILATAYRDYDSPTIERMVEEIQNSIMAYYALSLDEQFKAATNHKSARWAVESWKRQYAIDDSTGESYLPSEKYSNFALLLAAMYKGDSQSFIQGTFKQMYDLIQGTQEDNLFEQPDNTPRTLVEAIKETLNIEYDGQQRSNILASNSTASQQGEQRSNGNSKTGGRSETRNGSEDYQRGTQGDSGRNRSEQSGGDSQEEVTKRNSHLTEKEAVDFIAQMELGADIAQEIPLTIENWDKEFGEDGIVSTPIGDVKMGENQFTKLMRVGRNGKLGMIKPTLEYPDAIVEENSKAKEGMHTERPSSFIFIKSFRKSDGTRYYYFTSITVSVDGKEVVVSNQEKSRNRILRLLMENSVIWRTPKDATTSSAEKQGLDYVHPDKAEGETKGSVITPQNTSSASKVSETSNSMQGNVEKSSENEATRVETNPTEAQKEQLKSTQGKEADEQDSTNNSNVVHSFGNSASQNDTSIKLSDTSFAKMENGEQKAEREIGWLVDHNIRLEENSRKLNEIAHLLFDGDNIDSNRESTLREEAKKILEENAKLSRDYQKNYSDKYFGTDDITANYILQEANERLIALGVKPVKESYYFQSRKNEVAQNAVVHLLKRIGIPVHFITRVGAEASGQGNSRGWTNGLDIWLTKDDINADTPVHEYTHIWTFALMKKNPKLWAEIKNLLKDSEWVDKIQSMDAYKYTLDNEDLLYSEVLSRISGERNGEKFESMAFKLIEEVNSVEKKVDLRRGLEKLRDALKRFWEWVGVNLFGMKEFKSVDDVCDRVLFDLLNASDIARTEEMREYYEEESEMNAIIDKAKEDGTYLKTPNGEDSKLPEKVWAYARTKKFKTQLSDRLNLILNESKEDFKDWEKEEFRDLFKKRGLLEENNEPGRFLLSQFMYSEKYYDRKGKMQEEAQETMNSGKGGKNVSSVKSVDMTEEGHDSVALQVKQPIEQSKNLVALHNLSEEKLQQALELGGFPMPSIAITKANIGHTEFGNISLLFGKDSINPTDKRNKVYGGDAWTPTFPSIGYKLNSEKTSDIYRRANNVGSLPLFRPVFFHPDNYENKIDGQGSNGLVEHFKDDYGAKQMFLYEKGNAVEKFVQHEVEKYSDENVKFFKKILETIGLERLKNEGYDSLENEMKKLLGQYYDIDFDTMKPFRVKTRINSTIQKVIDYVENGNNKIENDIAATEEKIDERIEQKEFRKWLEKLFAGVVEKKGIRNEQDMFTPSGNRRKWENLYDAVTLDNAIKAMQTQAKKGGTGLFGGSIFGAASKELKEIEDIRNEAKLRINPISEEDYQAEKDRITERLEKVTIPSVSKSFSDAMDFVENVQDAVSKSHTAKGIYRHLHSLYPDMTMEVAKEIEDIVKDIQKISTRYLEAKPYRAVSFDEVKAAVVPSDTNSELIQQLKDRGIEVSTYEKDNQEQRKQIVNEVAIKEELLFRNDDGIDVVNERFNEELDNLTEENADKITLWLGNPSDVLLSSGIENKPLKLYGNKVIKKMKKHGFALDELRDLPKAVADPIAVFDNYQREGNRTILTELRSQEKNIMVAVTLGKNGVDVDFNTVSSVFGKGSSNVVDWISKGYLAYVDKEKALNYLHFSERNISEAADNSRLSSAANIVKSFENPTNSSEKVLDRKTAQAEEVAEKERQQMVERANELAETLHLDNVEIVTDASTLEGKKAKAKGFYSTSTGKITIVIPNHSNIADVEKTLLHEAVAHYGLRKLFGEHFDNFLDNVFKNASEDVRREIVKLAAKNKWDFRIATEEYLASLAEDTNFEKMPNGFWDKIKRLFTEMLRSIGLLKQKDGELNDNELRYILWRSYKNLKEKGQSNNILNKAEDIAMQHRLKVGNYSESTDKDVRFREGEAQSKERVSAAERYEQRVSSSIFQSQEALQDSMLGLKEAMDAIMRAEGKEMYMEDIEGFENAYLGENRLSSVNQAETEAFAHLVFKPMLDEVAKLAKNDKERSELTDYMMAKHGLERNEVMRKNALEEIVNNEKLSDAQKDARASIAEHRDYAGLTALTDTESVEDAESEARRMVEEYEQKHDTTNLWDKVNTVTKGILSKSYECGMMNKQTYEKVRDMYQFYIPLRGFDEETSRDAYAYLSHGQSAFNAPIKTAKGRSSKADDPFANMQSMAESAIMQGNRNVLVKQKFLNFALNHPSDLVSVSTLWLKYDDVTEEWKPVFPDNIEETDTADEVEKKIQDLEQRMTELAKQDPEKYKHGKDTENIPYRIVESRDLRQHQVVVKRNGRDYVLTINGNPRAAQALNGLTNPDNDVSGAIGAILNFGEKINRQLSAFYTTRNPDFVISNFIRDMLYANSIVWVKERPNYALRFHRNIGRCNPAQMKILLSKHKKGELDMNNSLEHMFHQFIMNGGETGYANVRDIEQHKNDIQRELKRANGKIGIKRSLSLLGEKLDEYNRAVENCARFAAFLTSREMGRTIDRSIYDAKDISVNFNKKGSGAKFMKATGQTKIGKTSAFISGIGRSGYVFWNAAIQGTTNFGRQFKRHPAKAFTASATMFILGALIAGMGMGEGDDDDKNSYWNLPESVRRSNILFRTGDQWISIPLPVEYRSIYGMGELMISAMSGKEHFTDAELGKAIAGQVTQILPIDFLEGEGGVKAFVPSAVKPFAEVISNKGWTGMPIYKDTPYNKNMPEWTKTYKSANKYLIGLAKTLNEVTGGDAYTKGAIDINPAQIEYLLNGYFGGVSNTIDKLTKSAETIAGKRDYDPKSFLLLNRVLKSGDERTEERAINREYYRLKEEYEILRDRLKNYENDTDNGVFDFSEKINFLYNSPEYARYEIFEDYREDIEGLYKELKDAMSDEERAEIEVELTGLKKQMIEEMNTTRK